MEVQLQVKSNSGQTPRDYVFPMKQRVVLGRSPESAIPLEGTSISREHLALELVGENVYAIDLSNNGTWVNGNRLKKEERIQLSSGDSLELPEYQISFHIRGKAEAPSLAPAESQAGSVKVVAPAETARQEPVRREPEAATAAAKTKFLTASEIWTLLIALLTIGLIVYYVLLVS
jgi:predicted component of type VI protein secretion system